MTKDPPQKSIKAIYQECEQRALEITGGSAETLAEALDQWENEREALAQLHDENQAYSIRDRKLWLCLQLAEKAIAAVETDAGVFITAKARDLVQKFREQFTSISRTLDVELTERSANHVKANPNT